MTDQQKIIHKIARYWFKHRNLRFGQVLVNQNIIEYETVKKSGVEMFSVPKDIYYDSDEQILRRMKSEKDE